MGANFIDNELFCVPFVNDCQVAVMTHNTYGAIATLIPHSSDLVSRTYILLLSAIVSSATSECRYLVIAEVKTAFSRWSGNS